MIDHIDGKLSGELKSYVESHIQRNEAARKEYEQIKKVLSAIEEDEELEVPAGARRVFGDMVNREKEILAAEAPGKVVMLPLKWVYGIAAAVALILVGYVGARFVNQPASSEMAGLQKELRETKELVLMSMMRQESASERIKGVMASAEIQVHDDEILDALMTRMNTDDNVNVRLAAVDALDRFADNERVRMALIESLATQKFPAVQIQLINMLVLLREQRAVEPLQEIIHNDYTIETVKDEAHFGLFKLL